MTFRNIKLSTDARMRFAIALALFLVAGCMTTPSIPSAVRAELVPTGKLRVGLILSNQVLVTKDPENGALRGVTISIGEALAKRLGVPFESVGYANPAALVKSFGANEWDIAFLAFDPARAQQVDFSPPYMEVDNTYLVMPKSRITAVELADQTSSTIAVPQGSAPDLILSRTLKAAKLIRIPGGESEAIAALKSGKADAYAENAHMLSLYSDKLPGSQVLGGRYAVIQHAIAIPKGKMAASNYVKIFVEEAKADGTIEQAITAAGLRRTRIASAPPNK